MKTLLLLYLTPAVFVLLSCGEDNESPRASTYVIVSTYTLADGKGTFSTYNTETKELKTINFSPDNGSFIAETNVSGDDLYFTVPTYGFLKKINVRTGQEKKIKAYAYSKCFIDFFGENIVISSFAFENSAPYYARLSAKIYSKELVLLDSITGIRTNELYDTEIIDDNLYISSRNQDGSWTIEVIDLTTRKFSAPISSSSLVQQLINDNDNQLLCVSTDKVGILDLSTLKFKQPINKLVLDPIPSNNSAAYNALDDILYSFQINAQPAPTQYRMYSTDLNSGQATSITEFGDLVTSPLLFDYNTGVIIVGAGKEFKIYSKQGKLINKVPLPVNSYKIFIQ